MQMINLISRWPLKNGCPSALLETLKVMPAQIIKNEPGTLHYAINVPANDPVETCSKTSPFSQARELVFIESYQDASAFKAHLNGPLFTTFREQNLSYFVEDASKPGWPITKTTFLSPIAEK